MVVGEISSLQKVVIDSMNNYKKVELAQASVDGVKVDGLDTNLAVMKATDRAILALVLMALSLAIVPTRVIMLLLFLEVCTNKSPPCRASTERWSRRLREWWFSIPAAPVVVEEAKKKTR